jgi:excisionase family DNA binding protein
VRFCFVRFLVSCFAAAASCPPAISVSPGHCCQVLYSFDMPDVDVSAAARELGVSERTVRRWLREGRLAAYRVGGRIRIPAYAVREARAPYRTTSPSEGAAPAGTNGDAQLGAHAARVRSRREGAAKLMDEIAARSRPAKSPEDSAEGLIRQLRQEREDRG